MWFSMKSLNKALILWLYICSALIEHAMTEEHIQQEQLPQQQPTPEPLVPSSTAKPEEKAINYRKICFYAEPEDCEQFSTISPADSCRCRPHSTVPNSWVCCNIVDYKEISLCKTNSWMNLHIRNATFQSLDASRAIFQKLESLAITDGDISRIDNRFSQSSSLKCLNVSNNNLAEIDKRVLTYVQHLHVLDISSNNLSHIPFFQKNNDSTVNIRGNKKMLCSELLVSIAQTTFMNPDTTYCLWNQTYNWFNSTDYVPIRQLERSKRLQSECPKIPGRGNCRCAAEQMVFAYKNENQHLLFTVKVDCSNMSLIELPSKLPENTIYLNVSNNNITSIGNHFHTNPTYRDILKFDADQNQISSLIDLEGTKFMEVFQKFYIRKNAINKIPEYLLSNALDNNPNGRAIYLGGNELDCDCNLAKNLKLWLRARQANIPDFYQILCRNMPKRVVDLDEVKLCQSPHDWTDYIYYLIALEVILLIALIIKVSYDYWVFKTAGYLPWPASKMPKLPCDWLCES